MKKFLIILFLLPLWCAAQKPSFKIHKVQPKESFTSIGRLYNINGRELANYNQLDYVKGLSIGQEIKIPVTFSTPKPVQKPVVPEVKKDIPKPEVKIIEKKTPIYHTVGHKETLYHISTLYGKVPIADLKKWNNLTTDGLKEGSQLIVGYKVADPEHTVVSPPGVYQNPPVKVEEKKSNIVTEVVTKKKEEVVQTPVAVAPTETKKIVDGGFFSTQYQTQSLTNAVTENAVAAVFKSNSGWEDAKFYCLHNAALQNSIAKITNTANGKVVYVKVLDVIPDIKQNAGITLRINDAAAHVLGAENATFDCTIIYLK